MWPPERWVLGSLTEPPLPGCPPGLLPAGEKGKVRPQDLCLLPRGGAHARGVDAVTETSGAKDEAVSGPRGWVGFGDWGRLCCHPTPQVCPGPPRT